MVSTAQTDTAFAEMYDKRTVPVLSRPLVPKAIDVAAPCPGEAVVDVACGTGIVARLIAPRIAPGGLVAGVDNDPAMIAVARSSQQGLKGLTVEWHCANALDMPFMSASKDIAFCVQGLQYFPDCVAALLEMRRVLKPNGRLVAVVSSSLEDCKGHQALVGALEHHGVDATVARKAHWTDGLDRLRHFAVEAGFEHVDIRVHSAFPRFSSVKHFVEAISAGSGSSRTAITALSQNARNEFFQELKKALREYHNSDGVVLPLSYLLLLARP